MSRVTGIGGIFFKARDAAALREWYRTHLGIDVQSWGGAVFRWNAGPRPAEEGATVWSVFPAESTYLAPSDAAFMINYRVENLVDVLAGLRAEGCTVDDRTEESELGKFGWVMDPEGHRIELWEPPRVPIG